MCVRIVVLGSTKTHPEHLIFVFRNGPAPRFLRKKKRPCHTAGGVSYLTPSDVPAGVPTSSFSDPEKRCQQHNSSNAATQRDNEWDDGQMTRASAQGNSKLKHQWARSGGPSGERSKQLHLKKRSPSRTWHHRRHQSTFLAGRGLSIGVAVFRWCVFDHFDATSVLVTSANLAHIGGCANATTSKSGGLHGELY